MPMTIHRIQMQGMNLVLSEVFLLNRINMVSDLKMPLPFPVLTTNTVAYPARNPLAVQLQKVAWCINAGLKTRVYFVTLGGFDTHVNQFTKDSTIPGQGQLHKYLGEAISLFQKDIENMGLADNVIGMTYSEFGRRVNQNSSQGTDHGTSAPMFLFGKPINGEVYGRNPNLADHKASDPTTLDVYGDLAWEFDFRKVYAAILTQWFGSDELHNAILNKPNLLGIQAIRILKMQ